MNSLHKIVILLCLVLILASCSKTNNKTEAHANALINETSPYLLQHAYNPVDWKAWNKNALEQAKKDNKLIIVSVGYSSCHWCHVMEEESFENDSVAKIMNDNFISIKVDREERPDIDQIYMNAVQLMTGSGGWPLNCITLPDGRPVFGGTYFTKTQWLKVLDDISKLYKNEPEKVIAYAQKLTEGIKSSELITLNTEKSTFKKEDLKTIVDTWKPSLDLKNGGQLGAPKFPMPSHLNFLLRHSVQNNDTTLKTFLSTTLTKMAYGGIYDHIGGGFSRYSVDNEWHIPHFEKMLYDNAQLVSLYSNAYAVTKNENYKTIVIETLNFVNRELTHTNGAFYSSIDADSKTEKGTQEEGAFYAWTRNELEPLLAEDFNLFKSYYNINDYGKWENNTYVLVKTESDSSFAMSNNISIQDLKTKILNWKHILFEERQKRELPRTDDKILTSWNSLMLKAYIDAYRVLGNKAYLNSAIKNATFLKENQLRKDGGLNHSFKDGKSTIDGFLEDYAILTNSYISLYEVTLDEQWLKTAGELMQYTISHFLDAKSGMFYFTSDDDMNLITRKMEVVDKAIPSSNSIIANNLFKLSHYYSNSEYAKKSQQMLNNLKLDIETSPSGYSNWLNLYLNFSNPYYEVAISGKEALDKVKSINKQYLPNILIAGATNENQLPLLKNRYNPEATYIYVCVNGTCKLPETDIENVIDQLLNF